MIWIFLIAYLLSGLWLMALTISSTACIDNPSMTLIWFVATSLAICASVMYKDYRK